MEEFAKNDYDDSLESIEILREKDYWKHFSKVAEYYRDLANPTDPEFSTDQLKNSAIHFLHGNLVNLVKGISMALSSHFSDGNVYIRRTVESMRYLIFMRSNPQTVDLWIKGHKSFDQKYMNWLRLPNSQSLIDSEFHRCNFHFKYTSSLGPHSNSHLFSYQHVVERKEDKLLITSNFRDLDPDGRKLLQIYFWHLETHFKIISWWIYKSGWANQLKPNQISFWGECRKSFETDKQIIKAKYKPEFLD